jgi:Cytochrome C assembly protein
VPIALTAYASFGWGAWKALRLLWTGERRYDLESYTAIHIGVIFGLLTLVTGSIWAKISWGQWWTWGERQLVLFLILFLFYSSYFMLRYSTESGPRRERNSAVYALFGVVLIPVSFLAVRIAGTILHPTVFTHEGAGRQACGREPARAPGAARVTTAEKYVTGAYLVLLGTLLVYLLIIALKVSRLEQELTELTQAAREKLGG